MCEEGLFLREEGCYFVKRGCSCVKRVVLAWRGWFLYMPQNEMIMSPGFQNVIGFRSELAKSLRGAPIILMIWVRGVDNVASAITIESI